MLKVYQDVAIVRWLKLHQGPVIGSFNIFDVQCPNNQLFKQWIGQRNLICYSLSLQWLIVEAQETSLPNIHLHSTLCWYQVDIKVSKMSGNSKLCSTASSDFATNKISMLHFTGPSKLCSIASSDLTTNKIVMLHFTGPLWGESTSDWWIPLTKGQ